MTWWLMCYVEGMVSVWLMGPLTLLDHGGYRTASMPERLMYTLMWPLTWIGLWIDRCST